MKKSISLKKRIIVILVCLIAPMVLALVLYAANAFATLSGRVAELNRVALGGYVQRVEGALKTAELSMLDIVGENEDFRRLSHNAKTLTAYTSAYGVLTSSKSILTAQPSIACLAVYSASSGQYQPAWASRTSGKGILKEAVRQYVLAWPDESWDSLEGNWRLLAFEDEYFLCRVLFLRDAYLFCLVDLENLAAQGEQLTALSDAERYVTSRALAAENDLPLPDPDRSYVIAGAPQSYMILTQAIDGTVLRASFLLSTGGALSGMDGLQRLLILISAIALLLIPFGYWWLSRALFQPVDSLVGVMEVASQGDLQVRAEQHYQERELRTLSTTFNTMMDQIQHLKIESYEKELEARQAQLSFLQMQIRPHFYLNCLKNLYSMAQQEAYADIQGMLVVLSDYLRYMMQSDVQWVTLEEEMQNSRSYIRLQQYNMAYPPRCNISVDTAALGMRIPPITVLTLVENSIKYAQRERQLEISIRARRLNTEDGTMLLLSVQDNGSGFPPELLARLNHMDEAPIEERGIGLRNVWMRMRLLYGERCGIAFSNENGARVELFFVTGGEHDTVDRG